MRARRNRGGKNTDELTGVKVTFLGKSGRLTGVMKNMRDVPPAERPAAGKLVNDVRVKIESALDEKFKPLRRKNSKRNSVAKKSTLR
ncbi:MAG: hypothetical protein ACLUSP_01330 [Christensenellales bacterium]